MYEAAYKKQPGNEELGCQTFFANVRASHWKSAQQVCALSPLCISCNVFTTFINQIASKMYKQFQEERYLYWSVISSVLQVL